MINLITIAIVFLVFMGAPAKADPVSLVASWIMAGTGVTAFTAIAIVQSALSAVLSLLATAVIGKLQKKPGVDVNFEVEIGDDTPLKFVVGKYPTAGKRKYIGDWGPNTRYVTEVIELSGLPQGLAGIWVNDSKGEIDWDTTDSFTSRYVTGYNIIERERGGEFREPIYSTKAFTLGHPVTTEADDGSRIWIRYHDGTQTAVDELLMGAFGDDEEYPITENFIGTGKSYVVITTQYDSDTMNAYPTYLWEMAPLPVYDPRKDSTVGGIGSHRWGNRSTYEPSENAMVVSYNIARGIYYGSEWVFGGRNLQAWRLPLTAWIAAMNAADAAIELEAGGTEPAYRCGAEISVDMQAAEVLIQLGVGSNTRFIETGGRIKPVMDLPSSSVLSITDESIIVSEEQGYSPFFPVMETYNSIQATYPEPEEKWATKDAPEYIDTDALDADKGRYLPAVVSYTTVPFHSQVQRLMRSQIKDYRRFARHQFVLPGIGYALECGDMISWTSERNGYINKRFIVESAERHNVLNIAVSLREVDPGDYDWSPDFEMPVVINPPRNPIVWGQSIPGFFAEGSSVVDKDNVSRRPAILVGCGDDEEGVTEIQIRVRLAGEVDPFIDIRRPYNKPFEWYIVEGILPNEDYEVQGALISRLANLSVWSDWLAVTTPNVTLTEKDFSNNPPTQPTGLTLSSTLTPTGAKIIATWTAPAGAVRGYDVRIRQGAGNDVAGFTTGTRMEWEVPRNTAHTVSVRAVDRLGNPSGWTAEASITSAADTIAPATPTGLTVATGFGTFWVSWNYNTESDMAYYELYESATTTPAPNAGTTPTATTPANQIARVGYAAETTRHFWVRAVDTSGNKSAWTSRVAGTTPVDTAITNADLVGLIDATSFASSVKPIEVVNALPGAPHVLGRQVFLTTDEKLYRNTGSGWTSAVDGNDLIANSVTTGAINTGAITADQLAAGAAVISKLGVMDWMNLVPGADLSDPAAWLGENGTTFTINTAPTNNWEGPRVINATGTGRVTSRMFGVDEGAKLLVRAKASVVGASAVSGQLRIHFYANVDDIFGAALSTVIIGATTNTFATEIVGEATVPLGAAFARVSMANNAASGQTRWGAIGVRRKNGGELIVDGAIKGVHLTVDSAVVTETIQIKDAIVTSAKIVDLTADKITVPASGGLNPLIQVGSTGVNIGTVQTRAADPAARINAHTTTVDAGKILISGAAVLSDWRRAGDLTKIDGGALSANTVAANKLTIGNRAITLTGIEFEHNKPSTNQVSWTAGQIRYINDAGNTTSQAISAGNGTWGSGVLYIYWTKGSATLNTTTAQNTAFAAENVVLATYQGGRALDADYGRTIVDGASIKTGTVKSDSVDTTDFNAAGLALFGTGLKSTNYAESGGIPTAGFNLIAATGEIRAVNVITRRALTDGSVSDGVIASYAGPYSTPATQLEFNANSMFNLTPPALGRAIDVNDHFLVSVGFELRVKEVNWTNESGPQTTRARARARFQYRVMQGGVWGTYFDQDELTTLRSTDLSWQFLKFSRTFVDRAENVQVRLQLFYTHEGFDNSTVQEPALHTNFQFARNINICMRAVQR